MPDKGSTGDSRFISLLDTMRETHVAKAKGYGSGTDLFSNIHAASSLGFSPFEGVLLRMQDKWERIKNLRAKRLETAAGESIADTLLDLANYALIAIVMLHEEKEER